MFKTIFCAVPAFNRVDPVKTSGPISTFIAIFASWASGMCSFEVIAMVVAPRPRAYLMAANTYGVVPLAAIPSTTPPSRNECSYRFVRNAKRRRNLRRIQNRHPPARSRAHINQSPAAAHRLHNRIHRPRNSRQLPLHRLRHLAIFAVHQTHNLHRRHPVEVSRSSQPLLRPSLIVCSQTHPTIIAAPATRPPSTLESNTTLPRDRYPNPQRQQHRLKPV